MTKLNRHTGCIKCGSTDVRTMDSRHDFTWRMRRKRCFTCGHKWTTYEIPVDTVTALISAIKSLAQLQPMLQNINSMLQQLEEVQTVARLMGVRYDTAMETHQPYKHPDNGCTWDDTPVGDG